ncbi:putative AlkP superfamily phosphohydrolase/phosphomutase [Desulfobaculum xiamenense]|uniref:Putative AlkP superfamily phosphohydrolase/phosphomutase n=1 Tax=Desulfobaculum xiamenense TaxID=995050 RepID=A0A846QRX9_9BACT|nr:alkaline phosphatase family protein [Desulfobaculum xiamenense]NJB67934.1 putative AlkP superfamily phosphohydrolase/phosphomutase [Desulfobaculum xiamenense]
MQTTERPRMVVLGLDGMPLSLLRELCEAGVTPHLARLALSAQAHEMRAELPELSPVNWTSFATAAGPEEHGVFGFTRIDPRSYAVGIVDSTAVRVPTIFDRIGERGLSSRVVNLPNMYPARPMRGMLVAGFVAPELSRAVFPPFLAGQLRAMNYRLEADTVRGRDNHDLLLSELSATLDARLAALDLFWRDMAWDLFVFVLTEPDRLFHFLFPAMRDVAHPLHGACMELFRHLDRVAGALLERYDALPGPKRLVALADHGFTDLVTEVDMNAWLAGHGYLRLEGHALSELDASVITPSTTAFALDPGRIYLHTAERFARGRLGAVDAMALRHRLREELLRMEYAGRPVMRAVHLREELYPGPMAPFAPDLVCEAQPGMSLTAKFDGRSVFGLHGRSGAHAADGAFFYDSAGERAHTTRDAGRLVLDFFGCSTQY